ncbi:alpha/beta fold hydrolase [Aquimarina litoralis]|uniref:alpha/beta fold hydrolase n=1 Tax=Aquimarina litoralis TaxID=584605 RepID=UPI001C593D97|nr:alpha/beta hydrolase [Aquimarina litoralis]MBW1298716.1 alpha/beta fold hydrolase [Aquimarina litoralis]
MRKKRRYKRFLIFITVIFLSLFFLADFDIPVEELKEEYTYSYSSFVEVDGMMVHYTDQGSGVPIVLLHGSGGSLHTWEGWANTLKANYRVISIDLPAFGLTGPHIRGAYAIEDYTKFLYDFVNKLELKSFHLAGNSLGGGIAWSFALDYPEKVKKLLLLDASGYRSKPKKQTTENKKKKGSSFSVFRLARIPVINKIFLYFTPKFIIRNNLEQVYYDDSKVTDALVKQYHDFALREGNRQAFMDRLTMKRGKDTSHKLKEINNPTLILWGENDRWISVKAAYKFDEDIPNSKLVIMKETGHLPMEEKPEESVKIAMDFLSDDFE